MLIKAIDCDHSPSSLHLLAITDPGDFTSLPRGDDGEGGRLCLGKQGGLLYLSWRMGQEKGVGLLCERATVTQHRKWDAFSELKDACRETLNFNVTLKKEKKDSWSAKHKWTRVLSLQDKLLIKTPQSTVKVTHNNELNNSKQKIK